MFVLDTAKKPKTAIFFPEVTLDGKKQNEICQIKITLDKDISPQTNLKQTRKEVLSFIEETFILLDDILKKRAKPNISLRTLGFKYYVFDKDNHIYNAAISLQDRFNYVQFIPQLDYKFAILGE